MKHIIFIAILLLTSINIDAQPPQGGGRRSGEMGQGGSQRPPMRGQMGKQQIETTDEYWIMNFPVIPNLGQDDKRKIIDLLVKEKKDLDKLIRKKMDLEDQMFNAVNPSEKEVNKLSEKIDKIESDIRKTADKYNKKYSKILTSEQLVVFKEKRREIKFRKPRNQMNRPMDPNSERRPDDGPGGEMPPPPPSDMFMPGGGGPGW